MYLFLLIIYWRIYYLFSRLKNPLFSECDLIKFWQTIPVQSSVILLKRDSWSKDAISFVTAQQFWRHCLLYGCPVISWKLWGKEQPWCSIGDKTDINSHLTETITLKAYTEPKENIGEPVVKFSIKFIHFYKQWRIIWAKYNITRRDFEVEKENKCTFNRVY